MSTSFMCKAPWVSMAFQPNGKVGPCCVYDLSCLKDVAKDINQTFISEQQEFLTGKVPAGCSKCHELHTQGLPSYAKSFDQYHTDFETANIQEINVKSNNICNLACRSCGPHFSSKWEDEFANTIKITKDNNIFDKIKRIDFSNLTQLVIAGGEPTMQVEHVEILDQLIATGNTDIVIRISTNLHNLQFKGRDLIKLWQQFPNLQLQLSIDAIEQAAHAVRSGTNWPVVDKNLKTIIASGINHYASITISALNIWFLEETLRYLENTQVRRIGFNVLSQPDILSMSVIPVEHREKLNHMLENNSKQYPELKEIQQRFNSNDSSELWQHFLIFNLMLDQRRQENWFDCVSIRDELLQRWVKSAL